jgi:uncharacterized protein (TIGR03118 family)
VLEDRCLLSAGFLQTDLVASAAGLAEFTDRQLVNPWGLTASGTSPFWVSDNQTGFSTLYNGQGVKQGLIVNIPSAPTSTFTHATPTGTVFNTAGTGFFDVVAGNDKTSAVFLFDTLDGTISAWNPGVNLHNAVTKVTESGAVFTGLAIDSTPGQAPLLYAADWGKGTVEVYNGSFQQVDQGAFQDGAIPPGFRPFNVQDVDGNIWVTYAQFDPTTGVDTGTGGFVAEFTRDGVLEQTLGGHGKFNSPWGIALAPQGFGDLGGDLLVGNFGDGRIHAFDPHNGNFRTTLTDTAGKPIAIENLWALRFGNGANAGSANTLFFTAGLVDDPTAGPFGASAGLFGSLQAVPFQSAKASIVPNLQNAALQSISTVPDNGDVNPYGVAFVPRGFPSGGVLQPGDVLVSNFNNNTNTQGTGTTIVRITPSGQRSVFFTSKLPGLSTALTVLKSGFVIVGNVPNDGNGNVLPGSLQVLDSHGQPVTVPGLNAQVTDPWDLAVRDRGQRVQLFVANVSGLAGAHGTVVRIDLEIRQGTPHVLDEVQIGSGFTTRLDPNAFVLGPTGLAFDARRDVLYVASTADNAVFAIPNAAETRKDEGTGKMIFQDPHLRGPLGLVLAPNGHLITANGDAVNPDPTQPSELVEFTPQGRFVGQFSVDPNAGSAFGLAVTNHDGILRLAAVDDFTNALDIWTFRTEGSGS